MGFCAARQSEGARVDGTRWKIFVWDVYARELNYFFSLLERWDVVFYCAGLLCGHSMMTRDCATTPSTHAPVAVVWIREDVVFGG
mmetsp:Transcript_41421/g.86885  ORF Transcript_41421/g.86885 Transcript_41421/m.86885 type:complete len:85 (+) Transcript_41421:182-436(+)